MAGPLPMGSLPRGIPIPLEVPWGGLMWLGEMAVLEEWGPHWAEPLQGPFFFRVVFLLAPVRRLEPEPRDGRIAVVAPSRRLDSPDPETEAELRTLREARARYLTGADALSLRFRLASRQREAEILKRQRALEARRLGEGFLWPPDLKGGLAQALAGERGPTEWAQALARAVLERTYRQPPLPAGAVETPLDSAETGALWEALSAPEPSPHARALRARVGPALGLDPSPGREPPFLPRLRTALAEGLGRLEGEAVRALAHREGIPFHLAGVLVARFVAEGRAEALLDPHHTLRTRQGCPFAGDRLCPALLPDLAWSPDLLTWISALQAPSEPTWYTVLPWALDLDPSLASPSTPEEMESARRRFFGESLPRLEGELRACLSALEGLLREVGETPTPPWWASARALVHALGARDPATLYRRIQGAGPPSQVARTLSALRSAGPIATPLARAVRYLADMRVGPRHPDLALERDTLLARTEPQAVLASPSLWPALAWSLEEFQERYRTAYREHHQRYHSALAGLSRRVQDLLPSARALDLLNRLPQLGPPDTPGLPAQVREQASALQPCTVPAHALELESGPTCPACGLTLDQDPPDEQVQALERAVRQALSTRLDRLRERLVEAVVAQEHVPEADRILKVVQAGDLEGLVHSLTPPAMALLERFLKHEEG